MSRVRPFQPADLDALYAICLATGDAGADAAHLYRDPRLIGEIYAAPYARLIPEMAFVAEDGEGVAGYIVGALDTRAFAARLEGEWWPGLRRVHADPTGTPAAGWTADQRLAWLIHHPWPTPEIIVEAWPAHLHMNLLPRLQGQGVGSRLLNRWRAEAFEQGARRVHLGASGANHRAIGFWASRGFTRLDIPREIGGRTAWFGQDLGPSAFPAEAQE